MRTLVFITTLFASISSYSQVICGTANENGTVTLTAPPNNTFTSIEFASYGTPNGGCNSFVLGTCHAANSQSIVEGVFIGQNSASIAATNTVFGDPCNGTVKRLYIQARYSTSLPLTLVSFTARKTEQNKVVLAWESEDEVNTSHFIIERSLNGTAFESVGTVPASGSGSNMYSFTENVTDISGNYFYRLQMADIDGRSQYSSIARINMDDENLKLTIYPNPAKNSITILSDKQQTVSLLNASGQLIKNLQLIKGSQTVNIDFCTPGIYFIKANGGVFKFIRS